MLKYNIKYFNYVEVINFTLRDDAVVHGSSQWDKDIKKSEYYCKVCYKNEFMTEKCVKFTVHFHIF